jgi:hypothetical protein
MLKLNCSEELSLVLRPHRPTLAWPSLLRQFRLVPAGPRFAGAARAAFPIGPAEWSAFVSFWLDIRNYDTNARPTNLELPVIPHFSTTFPLLFTRDTRASHRRVVPKRSANEGSAGEEMLV